MPRLTADQWAAIRIEWEGEPTASFSGLAKKFGVDNSEISRRARREGWVKRGKLSSINEAAQRKADTRIDSDGNATQRKLRNSDLATREESEELRAEINVRHRTEWAELENFRRVALKTMKDAHAAGDRASWLVAKTAADTAKAHLQALQIKQDGERKAWGMEGDSIKIDLSKASDAELEAIVRGRL